MVETVERNLPELTDKINAELEETARISEGRPSLESLKTFENEWKTLTKKLPDWKNDLTARAKSLEDDLAQITTIEEKWAKTLAELNQSGETPPEITNRIERIISDSAETRRQLEVEQKRVVALQSRVAEQQKRSDDALETIRQTRQLLVGNLLVQDSPPIFAVSVLANTFGYFALARLSGNAVLRSGYAAVILYAAVRIIDGLIIFALRFRPLNLLKMVREKCDLIQSRLRKFLRFLAFAAWLLLTLELFSVREPLFEWIKGILTAT